MKCAFFVALVIVMGGCDKPHRPKIGERHWAPAHIAIETIAKHATAAYAGTGAFPIGTAAPLPVSGSSTGTTCCWGPDHKCPVTDAWGKDPVWSALTFELRAPSDFSYTYESDGKTAKASAVGDWDCDMTTVALTIEMSVVDGRVNTTITEPDPNKD